LDVSLVAAFVQNPELGRNRRNMPKSRGLGHVQNAFLRKAGNGLFSANVQFHVGQQISQ